LVDSFVERLATPQAFPPAFSAAGGQLRVWALWTHALEEKPGSIESVQTKYGKECDTRQVT